MTPSSPLATYLRFVWTHRGHIGFGFLLTLFSSFGQTYFIGTFGEEIRSAFDLDDGAFGTVYSAATLVSGCCVIWLGHWLDHVPLRRYALAVCLGLTTAALIMGAARAVPVLWLALFLLRLNGQGLLSHVAMTTVARWFDRNRGKALALVVLGFAAGEAVLPRIAVGLKTVCDWRTIWFGVAAVIVVVLVPLVLILLRDASGTSSHAPIETPDDDDAPRASFTRGEVLLDPKYWVLLAAILAPPFLVTGVFFHQVRLVEAQGWTHAWFTTCFAVFAATQVPSSLFAGRLIDRIGARRLVAIQLIPLGAGLAVAGAWAHPASAAIFMALAGLTSGASGPVTSAVLAERYGVAHLGSIRAMVSATMVFSTAASPILFGRLIDAGVTMPTVTVGAAVWVAATVVFVAALGPKQPT